MSLLLTLYIVLNNSIEFEQLNAGWAEPLKVNVNFYLTFVFWKVMLDLATNLHKISSKITIKTPEQHQLTSIQCLHGKHSTTSLVFVPSTLNMKLFAGQLSSFCEDTWEICEVVPTNSCFAAYNLCLWETPAKELFGSKAGGKILKIYKIIYFGYFFKFMYLYHQMMATFVKIEMEAANALCCKK